MSTSFILCEGITDQILISYYLINICGWKYMKSGRSKNVASIKDDRINWYSRETDYLGIWPVGGKNFSKELNSIIERCKFEDSKDKNNAIKNLIVITDHDDDDSETELPESLNAVFSDCLGKKVTAFDNGKWARISVTDGFSKQFYLETLYLLIPISENGALETFVLNTISENDDCAQEVIEQVRLFIKAFHSKKYLTHKRDKIKAEFSVSLSIFSPDKVFSTMNEYLESVHWEKYKLFNAQFQELEKI